MPPRPHLMWLSFVVVGLRLTAVAADAAVPERPNIVIILADDLGYGDVGCYGAADVPTPNIDRLAAEGRRFTSGYCSASTCTPTRYSLLTGTYAFRVKGTGIAPPNGPAIIRPGTATLASLLKRAGYATAVVGKWHLGLGDPAPDWNGELKPGPLEIGFDHCLLLPTTNDRVPQVFVEDRRVKNLDPNDPLWVGSTPPPGEHPTGLSHRHTLKLDWSQGHNQTIHNGISRIGFYTGGTRARFRDEDLADAWIAESRRWIEAHRDEPFFLYFASHDIHVPRVPHERFAGSTKLGPRGDSIVQFDWCVGELMRIVDRAGLTEKTLFVLCSDNGPVLDDGYRDFAVEKLGDHRPAGPFGGGKYGVLEGGTRTPLITRWKGRVTPGVSDLLVSTVDLPTSLAALAGRAPTDDECLDSFNVLGALLGEPAAKGREYVLQQDNSGTNLGLRLGDWKLIRQKTKSKPQATVAREAPRDAKSDWALYYLPDDPAERRNLAEREPARLQEMQRLLERIVAEGRTRPRKK